MNKGSIKKDMVEVLVTIEFRISIRSDSVFPVADTCKEHQKQQNEQALSQYTL